MLLMLIISALVVGISLGLLGAGGSILTVPALILLLDMDEKTAITSSLLIVSLIALTGALSAFKQKLLVKKVLLWFALLSLPAASIGAQVGAWLPNGLQTIILASIMLFAAKKLFHPSSIQGAKILSVKQLVVAASITGFITGLVGVGGGFLIVPALVLYAGLTMQQATANSLVLIALNGAVAFFSLRVSGNALDLDWMVILIMAGVGALAVLLGQKISHFLDQTILKRSFSILLLLVALSLMTQSINTFI
ncbi:sulfite exporter TauE/SafE family protein [Paraglaciecola aquimarina]|uniref:Probable membrane transporter protein n=1 Tax=Paraglaciecola algarum TaxID=3050085 RepID=A0ABS9DB14_9ALTE|nr:sulfite exporter TauE/SafE family protein [Paraglaciecola sp. G1-23]MCF2950005.1 sulfite exporter TauE/SafE family protein [Paraglaciecola sp. G1-23]